MKQACSNQLTGELVTATDKATTNQFVRSNQIRIRATQTAASIEPNHTTRDVAQPLPSANIILYSGRFIIFRLRISSL